MDIDEDGYRLNATKICNLIPDCIKPSNEIFPNSEDATPILEQASNLDRILKIDNCAVAVFTQEIGSVDDILSFLEASLKQKKTAIIVTSKCRANIKAMLLVNSMRGTVYSVLIEVADDKELHNFASYLENLYFQSGEVSAAQLFSCAYTSKNIVLFVPHIRS
ncbi:MAG: hypothetical protein LUG86_07740 [Oscillospiraceae bacterium]|nr:hypothetical protein [Oscillospiraceae bacterium]